MHFGGSWVPRAIISNQPAQTDRRATLELLNTPRDATRPARPRNYRALQHQHWKDQNALSGFLPAQRFLASASAMSARNLPKYDPSTLSESHAIDRKSRTTSIIGYFSRCPWSPRQALRSHRLSEEPACAP